MIFKHRNYSWSFVVTRGHSWSFVVTRGHSWSLVVIRDHSWSLVCTFKHDHLRRFKYVSAIVVKTYNCFFLLILLILSLLKFRIPPTCCKNSTPTQALMRQHSDKGRSSSTVDIFGKLYTESTLALEQFP